MERKTQIDDLRMPSAEEPLRILFSACLLGSLCGYDGGSYGEYPAMHGLLNHHRVKATRFCPEDFAFGTPRPMCDIYGGDGFDVLAGKARVLTEQGEDWTGRMIGAAEKMLEIARKEDAELAILMDTSAACGSSVIYDGNRFAPDKKYQAGMGVCAAMLKTAGVPVISQRDFASLEVLFSKIDPGYQPNPEMVDHHQTKWYISYFHQNKN